MERREVQDWRAGIEAGHRAPLRAWLLSVAAMTFGVLVVGGITRLTLSGLSIVEWNPLMGAIPPLTEAQWARAFALYQQSPDWAWRPHMTMAEFKFIFFWEYLHRLLARTIGLVFLIPFVVFWLRGWFTRPLLRRALLLFALGAAQGVMGWLMVRSGLVDRPSVSHYRLAAHLTLAFLIFGWAVWLARELGDAHGTHAPAAARRLMRRGLALTGVVLALQVVWGAFVAGLRAGRYYPTFPLMGGQLTPPDMLRLDPLLQNFIANPSAVQWVHRVLGTLLGVLVLVLFVRVRREVQDAASRRYSSAFAALVALQYALGVATLLLYVPVSLGVVHQATAMVIFGVWLAWLQHVVRLDVVQDAAPAIRAMPLTHAGSAGS